MILGSFPSVDSRQAGFYYMHKHNRFWQVLSGLFNIDLVHMTITEKCETLKELKIALSDVIDNCEIKGSADMSIRNVSVTDIRELMQVSSISKIFLNGRKAEKLFNEYFPDIVGIATYLPSTSPANAKFTLKDLLSEWQILKIYHDSLETNNHKYNES
ncbi:MAG: DNA-deoxyinosine glycosylase [Bacilli bacterium]|nr:DNA-deoxyinosine glycosylase [Bacilli bacterium]